MSSRTAMKSLAFKALDAMMTKVGRFQDALNMTPNPAAFGKAHVYATNNIDPVFSPPNSMAVNDLAAADKLRNPLQSLVQTATLNDDLSGECDYLASAIEVTGKDGYFSYSDQSGGINTMTTLGSLERAINGNVPLIDGAGVEVTGFCKSYGLGSEVDEDRVGDVQREMQTRVMEIMDLIMLFRLQQRLTALSAIANNTAKTWSTASNPDGDLRAAKLLAHTGSGIYPTRLYFDETSWALRQQGFEASNTPGGFAGLGRSPEQVAAFLGMQDAVVSTALQKDSAGTLTSVFASKVLLFRNSVGASTRSNDIMKSFWIQDNGARFRVHQRQINEKVWRVAVTWRELLAVTGPITGNPVQQLTIS